MVVENAAVVHADQQNVERIIADAARSCGRLVVECSDVTGHVTDVSKRLDEQVAGLDRLESVTNALSDSQNEVVTSISRARHLSQSVKLKLGEGRLTIEDSVAALNELTDLVLKLGERNGALAGAMENVQETSNLIGSIARKSKMLALNATIEAAHAGVVGRAFAVVAAEVRKLADDTRIATEAISRTVRTLSHEAGAMNSEITESVAKTRVAQTKFAALGTTVGDIDNMVGVVDEQADNIQSSADTIYDNVESVKSEIELFAEQTRANGGLMRDARARLDGLETMTNEMLDLLMTSGARTDDSDYIAKALDYGREITLLVESHLNAGFLIEAELFDFDYVPVPGTEPQQLTCRFNSFADRQIRPILNRAYSENDKMIGCVIRDVNGYLPTHISLRSQPQGLDPEWNNSWSRNRRVIFEDAMKRAIACTRPFMINCYRMRLGNGMYLPLKSVFVPLDFRGRRWGFYEHGYVNDASATSEQMNAAALHRSLGEPGMLPQRGVAA